MDTGDLSRETYSAILIESEKFNHDLTLQFGLLSYECDEEKDFIEKSIQLIKKIKIADFEYLEDIFFGNVPNQVKLNETLHKILDNISKVKKIPITERHFDF